MRFTDKNKNQKTNIVLGVTGGIAAYKSAELVRLLKKDGFNVRIIMTKNARQFITPLTLAVLSENKVYTELFSKDQEDEEIRHISLAHWADLFVIAPATANVIAKIALGMADDLLTSSILAFQGPVIFAPSMNTVMISNSLYLKNADTLISKGYSFIDAEKGVLACGDYGSGRLADPVKIVNYIKKKINPELFLADKKILITASATREPIDDIRFISNPSTGKMGFALAQAARDRGAQVTLITGPTNLQDITGIKTIHITTASEMYEQVEFFFDSTDIFISAAAVTDFKPINYVTGKIKKDLVQNMNLQLEKNIDILKTVSKKKEKQILVGFAAEVQDLLTNACSKLKSKNLDFIVANDVSRIDSGFAVDTNKVFLIDKDNNQIEFPLLTKLELAERIFDCLQEYLKKQNNGFTE